MSFKSENYKHAAASVIKNMEKRGFIGYYCETKEDIIKKVFELIPEKSSVTWGGSETLVESGVLDAVKSADYEIIDRSTAKSPEEFRKLYARIVCADYFLTSTNAFTIQGELVNIDGDGGARVACITTGPAHVIVVASMNKMCTTVDDAARRIHTLAAPPNAIRVGAKTPCAITGVCSDCLSPGCICSNTVITRKNKPGRITVILTAEEMGF